MLFVLEQIKCGQLFSFLFVVLGQRVNKLLSRSIELFKKNLRVNEHVEWERVKFEEIYQTQIGTKVNFTHNYLFPAFIFPCSFPGVTSPSYLTKFNHWLNVTKCHSVCTLHRVLMRWKAIIWSPMAAEDHSCRLSVMSMCRWWLRRWVMCFISSARSSSMFGATEN